MRLSFVVLAIVLCVVFEQIHRCDAYHFKKHLVKFLIRHKGHLKKKGVAVAAAGIAAAATGKKKVIPVPFPLPVPIIHQPVIHDPLLTLKFIKQAKFSHLGLGGGVHGGGFGYG